MDPGGAGNSIERARFDPLAAALSDDIYCPDCSQNLRGTVSDRCPECGASITDLRAKASQIPWSYRATRGRVRCYVRTVFFVLFKTRRFCGEVARPVSYADAQAFRWTTVALVWLSMVALVGVTYLVFPPAKPAPPSNPRANSNVLVLEATVDIWTLSAQAYAERWPAALLLGGFFLFLAAASGLPRRFVGVRGSAQRVQDRRIALSHYAMAPMVVCVAMAGASILKLVIRREFDDVAFFSACLLLLVLMFWWILLLIRIVRHTTQCGIGRMIWMATALPACWLGLAALTIVVLPAVVLYVLVVADSLQ